MGEIPAPSQQSLPQPAPPIAADVAGLPLRSPEAETVWEALEERPGRRVALVCSPELPEGGPGVSALVQACAGQDITAEARVWSDRDVPWMDYHALLPLWVSDWDRRRSSFRHWLAEREAQECPVYNRPELLRWNMDGAYLLELGERGIAVPETQLRPQGSRSPGNWAEHQQLVTQARWHDRPAGLVRADCWQPPPVDVLVSPYQMALTQNGVVALHLVSGRVLAQTRHWPAPPGSPPDSAPSRPPCSETLDDAGLIAAAQVSAELPGLPLYARYEFAVRSQWQLLAVKLLHPQLELESQPQLAEALAEALRDQLEGPGLLLDLL